MVATITCVYATQIFTHFKLNVKSLWPVTWFHKADNLALLLLLMPLLPITDTCGIYWRCHDFRIWSFSILDQLLWQQPTLLFDLIFLLPSFFPPSPPTAAATDPEIRLVVNLQQQQEQQPRPWLCHFRYIKYNRREKLGKQLKCTHTHKHTPACLPAFSQNVTH